MLLFIVLPDNTSTRHKLKPVCSLDMENDDTRSNGIRQYPGKPLPVSKCLIDRAYHGKNTAAKRLTPAPPMTGQTPLPPAGDVTPPSAAAPNGHHPAFDVPGIQPEGIFLTAVVSPGKYSCRRYPGHAMNDKPVRAGNPKKNHIPDTQRPVAIRHHLNHFRFMQNRIHTDADIDCEKSGRSILSAALRLSRGIGAGKKMGR